jgi:RimJ/RimL family protein N-acetyltransferase
MEQQMIVNGPPAAGVQALIARPFVSRPTDWRRALPVLRGSLVTLREPRLSDAAALCATLGSAEVSRFMATPPSSIEGFERFIGWTLTERAAGNYACFVVVPHGMEQPIGLFQLHRLDASFETAEWGFALGSDFWSKGVYADAAEMVIAFAFDAVGVRRLEARTAVANGRGGGALRKMGATREAILEGSLEKDGQRLDQALWTIRDHDWHRGRHRSAAVVMH